MTVYQNEANYFSIKSVRFFSIHICPLSIIYLFFTILLSEMYFKWLETEPYIVFCSHTNKQNTEGGGHDMYNSLQSSGELLN